MHRRLAILFLSCVPLGCSSRASTGADGAPLDCAPADVMAASFQTDGSGAVAGSEVTATLCHVWAHVYVSPYTTPAGQALLMLDSSPGSPPQPPAGATGGTVIGMMAIDSPSPGRYRSSDGGACGDVDYGFYLPLPQGTDCGGTTPPVCPQNCASICSSQGCEPCAPNPPSVAYQAAAASDCLGNPQSAVGSWQIDLTSVTLDEDPSGDYYVAHGSVEANLESGASAAKLSLKF